MIKGKKSKTSVIIIQNKKYIPILINDIDLINNKQLLNKGYKIMLLKEAKEKTTGTNGGGSKKRKSKIDTLIDMFKDFVNLENKRWEENNKRWEENNKRWEEQLAFNKMVIEQFKKHKWIK